MLQNEFSTQKNEALNHSVATLAPKGKDYSQSSSLSDDEGDMTDEEFDEQIMSLDDSNELKNWRNL